MTTPRLTPAKVDALLDAAWHAWKAAPPRAYSACFSWHGRRYRVRKTVFRLVVDTSNGTPVAYRYQ